MIVSNFRHDMWNTFAGTKGGKTRIRIIDLLKHRPYNAHQLCKAVGVDYRTILYHLKILTDNQFIFCDGKRYGVVYFLTEIFEREIATYNEIIEKLRGGKANYEKIMK